MKKTLIPMLLAAAFAFSSCSSTKDDATAATTEASSIAEAASNEADATVAEAAPEEATPVEETASAGASAGDCDKFLRDYEEFATAYVALSAKYAKNPTDMSIMAEYGEMAAKAQEMQQLSPETCQGDAAFLKRYTSIAAKVTHAAAAQLQGSAKMLEQMGQ
ncbi:hypothetical protein GCM10023185_22380 [Hymenobacter saemangeumensis]|uniref:DUF6591 domain-containing protein n=1 Tax=Hymenobacter saemangeumensis TaxID=1084522 RepID=A0ABP8IF50_9BACT